MGCTLKVEEYTRREREEGGDHIKGDHDVIQSKLKTRFISLRPNTSLRF